MEAEKGASDEDNARQELLQTEAHAIEAENDHLRKQILEIYAELEDVDPVLDEVDESLERTAALEKDLAEVEAKLAVLREGITQPYSHKQQSNFLVLETARHAVETTVDELQKAQAYEDAQREEEEQLLKRDAVLLEDAKKLNEILRRRVQRAEADELQPDGEVIVLRLQGRIAHLTRRFRILQSALIGFIDDVLVDPASDAHFERHYSTGGEEDGATNGRAQKKRRTITPAHFDLRTWLREDPSDPDKDEEDAPTDSRAFQLKKLVETLMNRAVTMPDNPWLSLAASSTYQPRPPKELIDFVLRAGIAREDPKDPTRLRLEDFAELSSLS
ncbi:hypothetical protein Rhopal_001148-T1 [Rhodotorula paludigena]|uniref:Centromere protein Cenp-K n=1 Tax=Rhodotorula paludigena TaxID=86838 RepID=A0AAV5GDI7_9BASI|nr:hypothetical protein Rhopal_001148-T1 [Rhodotorula paludigena]